MTRIVKAAVDIVTPQLEVEKIFNDLGYFQPSTASVYLCKLREYVFKEPSDEELSTQVIQQLDNERRGGVEEADSIEAKAAEISDQPLQVKEPATEEAKPKRPVGRPRKEEKEKPGQQKLDMFFKQLSKEPAKEAAENPPPPDISVMSGNPPLPDIRVDKLLDAVEENETSVAAKVRRSPDCRLVHG